MTTRAHGIARVLPRLAARCPRCGSAPAVRISAELAHEIAVLPLDALVATYQCQRRSCRTIYSITAGDCLQSAG
jgi:hypothetical protein